MQRLLQRVEHEAGVGRALTPPADDPPGEGVDDEGDVDEAGPGRDIGEVGHPQRVRPRRLELPVDPSSGHGAALSLIVVRTRLAADHALQAHSAASAARPCSGRRRCPSRFSCRQTLRDAVDPEVLVEDAPDLARSAPMSRWTRGGAVSGSARRAACAW